MYNQPMLTAGALAGKTAIVTGGGTGLGYAMSKYFLELGANVVITSRKMDVLKASAEELEKITGGKVLPLATDVRNYDEVAAAVAATYAHFGSADILVNNAAGNFISPTERLSGRAFETIIGIVLTGTFNFTHALGKEWIARKQRGTVLNIVTTYAWTGSGYVVPSACAKAGVLAMTRSLAVEWAKYGIRLNAVAPGPFPTKGAWDRLVPPGLADKMDLTQRVPLKRNGEHQELANLAAFLVSDFSSYINGEVITIDGGEWLAGAGQFNMLEMVPQEMWDQIETMIRSANKK
jgi:NAD(P)-dependent dehydrogenase (short-subunit alcohol dehydrogenase family)